MYSEKKRQKRKKLNQTAENKLQGKTSVNATCDKRHGLYV
jgi:hypothetical protein